MVMHVAEKVFRVFMLGCYELLKNAICGSDAWKSMQQFLFLFLFI